MSYEWRTSTVGDIAVRVTKGTTPTTLGSQFIEKGIGFIKVESITDDGRIDIGKIAFIDEVTNNLLARSMLQKDDVLFTIAGTIGRVAIVQQNVLPANTNQAVAIVRPNKSLIIPRFLYYVLRDEERVLRARTRVVQSVQANFSLSELSALEIPLPGMDEQRSITQILGILDDKIDLNRGMNETLEAIAHSIFKSWFVDFDPVHAKAEGRDTGLPKEISNLFPGSFVDSEYGMIPTGWRLTKISELSDINACTLTKNDDLDHIDYIEISEVAHGNIGNIQFFERGKEPSRARRRLRHGDTILSTVRPDRCSYFLCLNPSKNLIASTGFAVISPTKAPWSFIHAALTQSDVFKYLGHQADGGAYPAVRPEVIGGLEVIWPDQNAIVQMFHQICASLYERIEHNRCESRTLATIRDTLLPKLISGELRVPEAERFIKEAST